MVTFYKCNTCGNQVVKIEDGGGTLTCCNRSMEQLIPASTDGALEKHVPVILANEELVECCSCNEIVHRVQIQVGQELHPSTDLHHIEWIAIETQNTFQIRSILPGDEPVADFYINEHEKIHAVYAYCNLHGLWEGTLIH